MSYTQKIFPNPNVWCRPGYCLEYVKNAFGLNAVYPSATSSWTASNTKHRDYNFPEGLWVPLWFSMVTEPNGHVVLRAPDGSIYSTSDYSNRAYHHPDLNDLLAMYANAKMPLVYLGWTEDVEGQRVVNSNGVVTQGTSVTPIPEEDEEMRDEQMFELKVFIQHELGRYLEAERGQLVNAVMNETVDGVAGDRLNLRQFLSEYRSHVMQDQSATAELASSVAAKAAAGGASIEEIQKAVHEALEAGVKVTVTVGENPEE